MSRVLSIQSHVVHGYVGNKSSSFPLQLLGFDVDQINTVQFSNHTRYKQHTGQLLSSEHLLDLVDGLEANSILHLYSHVLSGYQSASSLKVVFETVVKIKRLNPDLFYLMDPVLGDNGQLYCAPECIDLYISMCRVADLITPNDFEAKILTRVAIVLII